MPQARDTRGVHGEWENVEEITMNTMNGNVFFEDKTYSYETLRMLSHVYLRSSDVGEVFSTVKRIEEGNGKSWFDHWTATAAHLEAIGDAFLQSGHSLSARDTFIRAANYYRQAEFFIHDSAANRQLATDSSDRAVRCFRKAMPYFPGTLDVLEVPYEDITLPSYFWRAAKPEQPAPTLIVPSILVSTARPKKNCSGSGGMGSNGGITSLPSRAQDKAAS